MALIPDLSSPGHWRKISLTPPPPVLKQFHVSEWGWDGGSPANSESYRRKQARKEKMSGTQFSLSSKDKCRNTGREPRRQAGAGAGGGGGRGGGEFPFPGPGSALCLGTLFLSESRCSHHINTCPH